MSVVMQKHDFSRLLELVNALIGYPHELNIITIN
jgi:hypothetical protein